MHAFYSRILFSIGHPLLIAFRLTVYKTCSVRAVINSTVLTFPEYAFVREYFIHVYHI